MKQTVKLNEEQLRNIIRESIKNVLNERYVDRFDTDVKWDNNGLDSEQEDSYVEMEGWVRKMCELFDARTPVLQSVEDIQNGTVKTRNGLVIEYSIVDYGNTGDGIECDVHISNQADREEVESYIQNAVSIEPSFFKLDMNYEYNPNFIRFRLIPFNLTAMNESQLRNIIRESITTVLKEYRDVEHDPDKVYISPSNKTNIGKNLNWYSKDPGKRALSNDQGYFPTKYPNRFSHGKGFLCGEALRKLKKIFQVSTGLEETGEIRWTEDEKRLIEKIYDMLYDLASLSKIEGNKKRGYNG